ncbi:MAG: FAD-dependent oxidoreductase, partial [Clostridia bacterium]
VGVGCYNIDLHITTVSHSFFYSEAYPFEIPLGALIPDKMTNLLPACKNIGTTHLTNGCYRLHPIEWNIGEVVGLLCVYAKRLNKLPFEIYIDKKETERFQDFLIDNGVQLRWNNIV